MAKVKHPPSARCEPTACLACGSPALARVLDLGEQPPANLLLEDPSAPYPTYPLGLAHCRDCGHGQLTYFVPPSELFRDYPYASGTSGTLGAYFDWFCTEVVGRFERTARVLEIACNDGSLLSRLVRAGYRILGIDCAENLTAAARERGLPVVTEFWPCPGALGGRRFDLIIAMNVLAHTPEPLAFLEGVAAALADDGVCVVQTSQAKMLINGEFDTIYHEHYSFFTPRSIAVLARRAGLRLQSLNMVDIHGSSFAAILTKPGCRRQLSSFLQSPPYAVAPDAIALIDGSPAQYAGFARAARQRIAAVRAIVARSRAARRKICCVGAAAKGATFLHSAGIVPDCIYDEAPLKIGRYLPGIGCAIRPLEEIAVECSPLLVVLSAWNFRDELTRKTRALKPDGDVSFLVYFPVVEEFV
jgi:hypothetical protein